MSKRDEMAEKKKENLYDWCYIAWKFACNSEYPPGSNYWMTMFSDQLAELQGNEAEAREAQLVELVRELSAKLESARGWVATHAMQTYSRVADKEAGEISDMLEKARAKLIELNISTEEGK